MPNEDIPLREVQVRRVRFDELARWKALMREHHYLGFRKMAGKPLYHVAVWGDRWLALLGWHAAALHCAARESWIGWSPLQRRTRLFLVVGNSRFLLLPEAAGQPGLASRVLGRSLRRLASDWRTLHGFAPLLAETFVDPAKFRGTCYRAANWIEVGRTRGFGRTRAGPGIQYVQHGAPKIVFVYPLHRAAREQLSAVSPRPEWRPRMQRIRLSDAQLESLWRHLAAVSDPRSRHGRRYPLATILALVLAARLAGCQTLSEITDFGRNLGEKQLRRIGVRKRPQTGRYQAPCLATYHNTLKKLDADEVDRQLADWMGEANPGEQAVAVDGKWLRGSYDRDLDEDGQQRDEPPQQHLSAVAIGSGVVLGQTGYTGKKNDAEAAALRRLVEELGLRKGAVVVADALHTQRETAELLERLGLHYIFTVKKNQKKIRKLLAEEHVWDAPQHVDTDCAHGRIETRSICVTREIDRDVPKPWIDFPGVRFAAEVQREAEYKKTGRKRDPETAYLITNLPPEKATPQNLLRLNRGYWGVENKVHYVRDVALREDANRCRKGSIPRVLASFANLALTILRMGKATNIRQCMRNLLQKSKRAVKILHNGRPMGVLATA